MSNAITNLDQDIISKAYFTARILNHVIGFEIIKAASREYRWNINMSELARIWTNGCIIRSDLMLQFIEILNEESDHLLLNTKLASSITSNYKSITRLITAGLEADLNLPVFSSCLNYFLALKRKHSPANLIAAQRDYFGAHGYFAVGDSENSLHHTDWNS